MNRNTVVVLCLTLCLVGATVPTTSAAVWATSTKTALTLCLQQEYLMRDMYQNIFAKYPTLQTFGTLAVSEISMIAALKKLFAKYRINLPSDTQVSAAKTMAATATSMSAADGIALDLERSVATAMARLLQSTRSTDVTSVEVLIMTTSLGSHTTAFRAEQASISAPAPATRTQRVVSFTPTQTSSEFLTLLADESIDVIELNGTYSLPELDINIDRTRPVVVRPTAGATVIMSGAHDIRGNPQLMFGYDGPAGNITMQGLIFDGYILRKQGIVQGFDCHDITLNDMIVRNSRADGTYAQPYHSWAIYLEATPTRFPTNFTANRWTVVASARGMNGLKVQGGSHITVSGWLVSHAYYAAYGGGSEGPLTDFVLDDWAVIDTGGPAWGFPNVSVGIADASGRLSSMHGAGSGILLNMGKPQLVDGGGNSL